jgi:hypothetical protein
MENQPTDKTEVKLTYEEQSITPTEVNMLENVVGRFRTVSLIPTTDITPDTGEYYSRPTKLSEQVVIYKNDTTQRLYWYDSVNDSWQYTAQPVSTSSVAVRVTKSTDQIFYDSTDATITWNGEDFDTSTMHDNSTNNSRLTCKSTGYYQISLNVGNSATTGYWIKIVKNGSVELGRVTNGSALTGNANLACISTLAYLAADDYVEALIQGYNFPGGYVTTQSHFEMHKI